MKTKDAIAHIYGYSVTAAVAIEGIWTIANGMETSMPVDKNAEEENASMF